MPRAKGAPHRVCLEGQKFNRLTVVDRLVGSYWRCLCDCGNEVYVTTYQLKSEKTKSCGCWSRDRVTKHGMEGSRVYTTWAQMLSRCSNEKNKHFQSYGGRGISVCERWKDFRNFYADMGEKPEGMTLERIDNDGNYEPSNCQWTSTKQQIRNRRVSPKYEFEGQMVSLSELCEKHNLPWRRIYQRMRDGWDIKDALTKPLSGRWGPIKRKLRE